jgi:signal transduction histidine kinase
MSRFEKLLWFFPHGALYKNLKTTEAKALYFREVDLFNFQRLRTIVIISLLLCMVMLAIDFLSTKFWDNKILSQFTRLDLALFFYLIPVLIIIIDRYPHKKEDIKPLHNSIYRVSILVSLIWVSLVSAIETHINNGMPTFVIGTFLLATIFIHRGIYFLLVLLTGLIILFSSLLYNGYSMVKIFENHMSSVFLVLIAYIASRIMYANHIKAYVANLNLEHTNAQLDELVKARTLQLSKTNEQLKKEIAAREKYEVQLKKQKEHAEQADRLKSSFLANMSHEIRTPLNGIVGFSDLLQASMLTEEKRLRYTTIIKKNSSQLLKIIDDIIDISMIESNQLKFTYSLIPVKSILDSTCEFYSSFIQTNNIQAVEFKCINQLENDTLEICTDPLRLQQAINNLISNAFKFTEKGYILLTVRQDEDELLFAVEDTGIGIAPEKSKLIFERFRQVDDSPHRAYGGTGLGLSISTGIINTLGGNIWLDYTYTEGSRFCFTLPVKKEVKSLKNIITTSISKKLCDNKTIVVLSESERYFSFLQSLFGGGSLVHLKRNSDITELSADLAIITPGYKINEIEHLCTSAFKNADKTKLFIISQKTTGSQQKTNGNYYYTDPLNVPRLVADISNIFN